MSSAATQAIAPITAETAKHFESEIDRALSQVLGVSVTNSATCDAASEMLRALVTRRKQIDEERKKVTGPLNAVLRTVNGWFKPTDEKFEKGERYLRGQIGTYTQRVERERLAAMQAAAAGAPAPIVPIPQHGETSGVSVAMIKKWRITNPDIVPRELCSPDVAKIQAAQALYPGAAIPGVEWYEEPRVSARKLP